MKLYFYILEQDKFNKKACIGYEECEVIEKPKTYKPLDEFPDFYSGSYVKKEDIGNTIGYNREIVVFTEKNDERAAEIFKEKCENAIELAESDIRYANKMIEFHKFSIDAIEEWRLSHETN